MSKHILLAAILAATTLVSACGDEPATDSATSVEPVSMKNFEGRWVLNQSETQSKLIDLSSDGNYIYEVRGAPNGEGNVLLTTRGTYVVTPEGNIASDQREARAPSWTGTRKGDIIEFSLNGDNAVAYELIE